MATLKRVGPIALPDGAETVVYTAVDNPAMLKWIIIGNFAPAPVNVSIAIVPEGETVSDDFRFMKTVQFPKKDTRRSPTFNIPLDVGDDVSVLLPNSANVNIILVVAEDV